MIRCFSSVISLLTCLLHIPLFFFFFFNDTATTEIYTLSLHDALPISKKVVDRELKRLRQMSPQSAEYHVARTYLEVIATLPWANASQDRLDLKAARDILDRDHYDLKTVKERILEYLAVRTLKIGRAHV